MIALYTKMWRDHWKSLLSWTLVTITLVSIQMSVYPSIAKSGKDFETFLENYPDAIKKIFRMQDYTTGAGFLSTELYSMMIPLVLIAIGATWGASATAEEEDKGTADILFSFPISRTRIVVTKILATISVITFVGIIAAINIIALRNIVHLTIDTAHLFSATASCIAIGLFFTSVAFVCGSLTSHKGASLGIATGISLILFLIYSLEALVDTFDSISPFNPFNWGLEGNALFEGLDLAGILKLSTASLVLLIFSVMYFKRKDIRSQ